jgi:DNA polymerase-3 subunit gamma/tau
MAYYQKYRPEKLSQVMGQDQITLILSNQIRRHKVANSYLFAGPSGTGKTTCARIIANAVAGSQWDIIEVDAARFRGIDDIKDLAYKANFGPLAGGRKVYIIDECHMLSEPAFNAMLKLLEDSPPFLVIIMCTTALNMIPETVRSRCQLFEFQNVSDKAALGKLQTIAAKEHMGISNDALRFIAAMATGNMRTAETMLEQVASLDHGSPRTKDVKRFLQQKMNIGG